MDRNRTRLRPIPHAQGSGLATEGAQAWITWATTNLPDNHLIAVINPHNTASTRG